MQARPLNQQEQQSLSPFFDTELLQCARIVEGRVPWWLHRNMCAVVLAKVIYFRKNAYQVNTAQGLSLLAHELVHVKQYLAGMRWWHYIWSCRRGYRQSSYEQEAYEMGEKVLNYFLQQTTPSKRT